MQIFLTRAAGPMAGQKLTLEVQSGWTVNRLKKYLEDEHGRIAAARQRGKKVWWYVSCCGAYGQADIELDFFVRPRLAKPQIPPPIPDKRWLVSMVRSWSTGQFDRDC